MLAEFSKEIETLKKQVSKSKAININSKVIKDYTIGTVKNFFSKYQNYLSEHNLLDESNKQLTDCLQDLLRLTQGNNPKKSYLFLLKQVEKQANELNIKDVSKPLTALSPIHDTDKLLIATLEALVPTAALSYQQALTDLSICNHKISYRGTAAELREALRETLDHLAPDKNVSSEVGFKLEQGQSKPTMKQKVRYILKTRNLTDTKRIPAEKSIEMMDELVSQLARAVYNRASLSTHVQTTKKEVYQVKRYIDLVFHEILELTP